MAAPRARGSPPAALRAVPAPPHAPGAPDTGHQSRISHASHHPRPAPGTPTGRAVLVPLGCRSAVDTLRLVPSSSANRTGPEGGPAFPSLVPGPGPAGRWCSVQPWWRTRGCTDGLRDENLLCCAFSGVEERIVERVTASSGPWESEDSNDTAIAGRTVSGHCRVYLAAATALPQSGLRTARGGLGHRDPGVAQEGARTTAACPEPCLYPRLALRKTTFPEWVGNVRGSPTGGGRGSAETGRRPRGTG